MKQFGLAAMGSVLLSTGAVAEGPEEGKVIYKVDTHQSNVTWTGKKVTGQHHGYVNLDEGEIIVQDGIVMTAGVIMDMNSVTNTDLNDPQWNQKLVGHLKSDDFFSVEKFPQAVFTVTSFEPTEEINNQDENYKVTGNLSIKGITHEISFPAKLEVDNGQFRASGTAVIDRTKWNIRYGSGSFFKGLGDNMIYNDFEIGFNLVANIENI